MSPRRIKILGSSPASIEDCEALAAAVDASDKLREVIISDTPMLDDRPRTSRDYRDFFESEQYRNEITTVGEWRNGN